ncbi:MAG: hypothetical protein PHN39_01710 [Candidatus Pacebacteria bacterium]|nr:hypothetical protein [Candidatus Paceibacterota bacterium]
MAKFQEKIKARELRQQGESINQIANQLKVSKSSASIWCKDITLTKEQMARLQERMVNKSSYEGRMKGARIQHERRLIEVDNLRREGKKLVDHFSKHDFLLAGAGLYWGEGSKYGRARIVNSDPNLIKFIVEWFKDVWGVQSEYFTLQVAINIIHKDRIRQVEEYWSNFLSIPLNQFTKSSLIKAKNKKVYKNFDNYYGTLTVTVQKGTNLTHKILGLVEKIRKSV